MQIYDEQDIEPEQAGDVHYIVRVSSAEATQRSLSRLIETVPQAMVASIQEHESDEAHLVSFVRGEWEHDIDPRSTEADRSCSKVPSDIPQSQESEDRPKEKWLLFNDFLVKEVAADEALSCAPAWKVSLF
jgi:hypothetical protein